MRVRVLGSAAGGGFPQWNCNCPNCDGVRKGTINAKRRTQSSIAVSSNDVIGYYSIRLQISLHNSNSSLSHNRLEQSVTPRLDQSYF